MRKTGKYVSLAALLVSGVAACTPVVRPSAPEVSQRLADGEQDVVEIRKWLVRRGYRDTDMSDEFGPRPRSGTCLEKIKANPLAGGVMVRVCFVPDEAPIVFSGVSLGLRWSEVYPNNMAEAEHPASSPNSISEETLKVMSK